MLVVGLTIFVTLFLLLAVLVLAIRKAGYSHVRDTISELGEIGASDQRLVAYGVFLPVGLVLLYIAYAVCLVDQPSALLAGCIAVGYIVAAFFPCDPGSPMTGSVRQTIHNLGGAVEYFCGCIALFQMAEMSGPLFQGMGLIVGGVGIALSAPPLAPIRGLIQRAAELCMFGGLLLRVVSS